MRGRKRREVFLIGAKEVTLDAPVTVRALVLLAVKKKIRVKLMTS